MQNEEEHLPSADGVVFLSGELGTVPVFAATAMALDGKISCFVARSGRLCSVLRHPGRLVLRISYEGRHG
jgi:hypothetical protein